MKIDTWGLALLVVGLGSLQVLLDKGQREDWFSSDLIVWLAVIAAVSLIFLIVIELYSDHPIVDLRVFRHRTFAIGNLIVFLAFITLFGTLVLLPLFSQKMMGYTSTLAGLALAPGGLATMIVMPIVARLILKINAKYILAASIAGIAIATFLMGRFNLFVDFPGIMWPRVVLGVGLACLFVPLTGLTLRQLPNEEMGNATAIYNLLRNLGGSVGIAFVTTMIARGAQIHQTYLSSHVTIFDRAYQWYQRLFLSPPGRGLPGRRTCPPLRPAAAGSEHAFLQRRLPDVERPHGPRSAPGLFHEADQVRPPGTYHRGIEKNCGRSGPGSFRGRNHGTCAGES